MAKLQFVEVINPNPKHPKILVNVQDIIEIRPYKEKGKEYTYLVIKSTTQKGISKLVPMNIDYEGAKAFFSDLIDIR